MKRLIERNQPLARAVLCLLLMFPGFLALTSCETTREVLAPPAPAWVNASRKVHDAIAPQFKTYVDQDPTIDMETRNLWHGLLGDWLIMIEQAEAAQAVSGAGE